MENKTNKAEESYIIKEHIELMKVFIYSFIGIFIFFIPININGESLTLIYHIAYKLQQDITPLLKLATVLYVALGCIKEVIKNKDDISILFYFKLFSILIILNVFYIKKFTMINEDSILILEYIILNLITVFPISAMCMTFLMDYGMLEIIESYTHKFMKEKFNISGKSLVNIFVYFFTDCFCGMFMTNKLYENGKLREKEACIIVLSFSILSLDMVKYICEDLDLNIFAILMLSMIILVLVNVVSYKIYPLSKKKKSYYKKTNYKETIHKTDKLEKSIKKYLENNDKRTIFKSMLNNLEESIEILINIIPLISISLYIGSIIINLDLIIEVFNMAFNPIGEILKISDKEEVAGFILNTFCSPIVAIENISLNIEISTKFLIAVIAIISSVPVNIAIYIKFTSIDISFREIIISYIQRVIIITSVYFAIYYFIIGYIM